MLLKQKLMLFRSSLIFLFFTSQPVFHVSAFYTTVNVSKQSLILIMLSSFSIYRYVYYDTRICCLAKTATVIWLKDIFINSVGLHDESVANDTVWQRRKLLNLSKCIRLWKFKESTITWLRISFRNVGFCYKYLSTYMSTRVLNDFEQIFGVTIRKWTRIGLF